MLKLLILTSVFPYGSGEEFFEREILQWSHYSENFSITIMPLRRAESIRAVGSSIHLSDALIQKNFYEKYGYALSSMCTRRFWAEVLSLARSNRLSIRSIKSLIVCAGTIHLVKNKLRRFIEVNGNFDLGYSYWNEATAYALCDLKEDGLIAHVISRAHGADLYEYRRPSGYAPFKRFFINKFDAVYVLADKARSYMIENYDADPKVIKVAPLGVVCSAIKPDSPNDNILRVLSLSYCVQLKRVDKIIDSLALLGDSCPQLKVNWTHIGGGALLEDLKRYAAKRLEGVGNVSYSFLGPMRNSDVRAFLDANYFDMIVNCSDLEGMPVSLMEAMSYGIPAIAPDIGEVGSLVNEENGILIPANPTVETIASAIQALAFSKEASAARQRAEDLVRNSFNEDVNYIKFISDLSLLAGAANESR